MSDNEVIIIINIIIIIIIIITIVNKMCGKEFLVTLLFDLLSWTPTFKFCLTRQVRVFSSFGNISYRIFPATVIMSVRSIVEGNFFAIWPSK